MAQHVTIAIATAAQHQIAAGGAAPGMEVSGSQGGALIVGIVIAAVLITQWRNGKMGKNEKKIMAWTVVMTVCLYGGGGIIGTALDTIRGTATQTSTTLTRTSLGE